METGASRPPASRSGGLAWEGVMGREANMGGSSRSLGSTSFHGLVLPVKAADRRASP